VLRDVSALELSTTALAAKVNFPVLITPEAATNLPLSLQGYHDGGKR
jgi:isopentenyl diphosphate isomerase/L-lactate dehydrogenase-like FMN-dependent dehydrogenase